MRNAPEPDAAITATLGQALGIVAAANQLTDEARDARLRDVRALWPVAATVLIVGPAVAMFGAFSDRIVFWTIAASGGAAALLGLCAAAILMAPSFGLRPPHHRIIALTAVAAGLAVALSMLLGSARLLPTTDARLLCFVAAAGAIIVTAIALHPLRIASLVFAATLAAMVVVTSGLGLAAYAAGLIATILGVGILRVARHDATAVVDRAAALGAERLAARLVEEYEAHGTGWFWQTDRVGCVTYVTGKVAAELTRLGRAPIGTRLVDIFRVDSELVETERTLTFHLSSRTSFSDYSVRPAFDAATDRWWSISGRPVLDEHGRFQGFIGSGSDLTEKRRAESEITRLALFDSLTGLANRQRMRLSLDQTLAPGRGPSTDTGLFLLDLDRFKAVNDTLGHQVGDELLKQVAHRLQATVGDAGLVGRLGGDEFKVVIPREGSRERLGELAERIISALSEPYYIAGATLTIGCSIGVAIAPEHGEDAETLVRNADLALYAAKADGRGVHRFYRDEMLAGARNRKRLEDDLRQALASDEFYLTYQPVVSTSEEKIVGYEALLRWEHPTRGLVSPSEFVPVAEECGLIERIGEWVLRTACAEAARWPENVRVAVNVSPIQFANPMLPAIVTNAIAQAGISPRRLELEITEGVFLNEDASSDQMFKSLKNVGVRLALDDFGTGYSSLGYLKKAPFDKIKIDQSFVRGAIQPGNRNAAIIKAIVTLAETLGMETTAEGVEQQDEIRLIRDLGCSHIQGFVYGRPGRAEDVMAQLEASVGGRASPIGHKVSRTQRTATLRSARLEIGDEAGEVRLRNISSGGAMIDGIDLPDDAIGIDVLIELVEDQLFPAKIRWAENGRAGLEFAENFDLERLAQSPGKPLRKIA